MTVALIKLGRIVTGPAGTGEMLTGHPAPVARREDELP
jgi:hypothetical protein